MRPQINVLQHFVDRLVLHLALSAAMTFVSFDVTSLTRFGVVLRAPTRGESGARDGRLSFSPVGQTKKIDWTRLCEGLDLTNP